MKKRGFTLIELMVVVLIIAILSAVGLIGMRAAQGAGRNATRYQRFNALRAALENCYSLSQSYPAGTSAGCWSAVVTQALTGISGSLISEGINYTGSGSCYTLSINVEPSGNTYPSPASTCPQ